MPRLILFVVLCVLIASPAHAMRYEGTVIKGGAGFMFSDAQYSFNGADRLDGDTQIGATAGLSTLWRTSRKSPWMLVFELNWVQRGYQGLRALPDYDTIPVEVDVLADFLSFPMLGRVHFMEDTLTMYATFGPSLEFRLSHDDDALLNEGKDFAIGANVGVGFEYETSRTTALQLDFRYYLDLTDSWNGGDLYTITQMRYQAFVTTVGFRF